MSAETVDTRTGEIVPVANLAEIESLSPQAREVAVTGMLTEARQWLAHAVESTAPQKIAEFKAFVATIAESTKQLNLSREIQLDAQEMVRRAERGVGLAIRKGQEAGEIRKVGDAPTPATEPYLRERNGRVEVVQPAAVDTSTSLPGPADVTGITRDVLARAVYAVTDGVTDERFDAALSEARNEGDLSRANVVRKVKGEPRPKSERPEVLRKTRHIDPTRIIRETVGALDGLRLGLDLIEDHHYAELDPADVVAWSNSLDESLRSLNRLRRQLKELHQA